VYSVSSPCRGAGAAVLACLSPLLVPLPASLMPVFLLPVRFLVSAYILGGYYYYYYYYYYCYYCYYYYYYYYCYYCYYFFQPK
jgi:hypothetical protein